MTVLLVALTAAAGTLVRVGVATRLDRRLPWGTLAVNVTGSFVLARLVAGSEEMTVLGTGAFGALTTWSAVAVGTLAGAWSIGERLMIGSVAIGAPLAAAWAGLAL